jgi:T-complex protein 1 subunit beta
LAASAVDNGTDKAKFEADLMNIARTTLSSKILSGRGHTHSDLFARIAVQAVLRLKGSTALDQIQIIKKPGHMHDSYLEPGFLLDKKFGVGQPRRIENAKILVANTPMDTDKIKMYGSRVRTDSLAKVADIEAAEKEKMKAKCDKIVGHGCNVFINRQLIYNLPEQHFADAGVTAIEHADFEGVERLALVLGADIVSTFDHPEQVKLGSCELVDEVMIGEDKLIRFSGVERGEACTIVLRGASQHMLDEAERSMHDALCVLSQTVRETRTTLGGGCGEALMARAVDEVAAQTPGKAQLAVEAYARALRNLPKIIADNAGYDATSLVAELRAEHAKGNSTAGLDMNKGCIGDMRALGITESWKVKNQVVSAASEAAEMILRVDDIIKCAPRERSQGY